MSLEKPSIIVPESFGSGPRTKEQQARMEKLREPVVSIKENAQKHKEVEERPEGGKKKSEESKEEESREKTEDSVETKESDERKVEEKELDPRSHKLTPENIEYHFRQENPIRVNVTSSSGEIESGWFATGSDGNNVVVMKDIGNRRVSRKVIPLEELKKINSLFTSSQKESIGRLEEEIEREKNKTTEEAMTEEQKVASEERDAIFQAGREQAMNETDYKDKVEDRIEELRESLGLESPEEGSFVTTDKISPIEGLDVEKKADFLILAENIMWEEEINDSPDFRQLFDTISRLGEITGSDGYVYDKDYLKTTINEVRSGKKSLDFVTNSLGLRDKVEEFLTPKEEKTKTLQEKLTPKTPQKKLKEEISRLASLRAVRNYTGEKMDIKWIEEEIKAKVKELTIEDQKVASEEKS